MNVIRMLFLALFAPLVAFAQPVETIYAITDVEVTHDAAAVERLQRAGYRPLVENGCVNPPLPGLVSRGGMADVNRGIGGDTVGVWVRYEQVPVGSSQNVLVDMAVQRWPDWKVSCPDGMVPADGDPKLTSNTKSSCNRNGLCVRYAPMKATEKSTIVTAVMLTRAQDANYRCGGGLCVGNHGITSMNLAGVDIHQGCGGEQDGPVWVYLCRNAERSPAAFRSVTAQQKLELLQTYAPRIYLAKNETFFPSDVEWSFAHMERYQNDDGNYWLRTKEGLPTTETVLDYFSGFRDVSRAPVYAFWVDKSGAPEAPYVDLIYFTYYPYNLGKVFLAATWGNHVGDWEHVTVRLQWTESGDGSWSLEPLKLFLPTHDQGTAIQWEDVTRTGSHPVVYSALGSHGVWPTAGSNVYKVKAGGAVKLIDETSAGTAWDTWNRVIAWDYQTHTPLTGQPWPLWMGTKYTWTGNGDPSRPAAGPIYRWGEEEQFCPPAVGACRLENGPTGPADKDVWRSDVFH